MGKFQKGISGNPAGRKPGVGKHAKLRQLLEARADDLVEKAVTLALSGDTTALKLCLERLVPTLKPKEEPTPLPRFTGTLVERGATVLDALGTGALTASDASTLLRALADHAKLIESEDLARRIEALEQRQASGP